MEYVRDTQCDRCHRWYGRSDLNAMGDGWLLCTECVEALYPSDEPEGEDYSPSVLQDENDSLALLVRTTAGLRVEVVAEPFYLVVTQDGRSVTADIEPSQALDAFAHPALYISAEQCAEIGLR